MLTAFQKDRIKILEFQILRIWKENTPKMLLSGLFEPGGYFTFRKLRPVWNAPSSTTHQQIQIRNNG
jgi:hypothetical protein